jgi:hypothetical protein
MLKITKKLQIQGIKDAIANRQDFGVTKWHDAMDYKHPTSLAVCMLVKNCTNYNQVKDSGFWAQDKATVKKQLAVVYAAIMKADPGLESGVKYGFTRHLTNYSAYHIIAKKKLLQAA